MTLECDATLRDSSCTKKLEYFSKRFESQYKCQSLLVCLDLVAAKQALNAIIYTRQIKHVPFQLPFQEWNG